MTYPSDGRGGGYTPWANYSLPTIWTIVNSQDSNKIWQQAAGWKNTADLTSLHLSNLRQYKDQLAEAWPPERSEASAAYLAELDKLISSVQETHDTASANHSAVQSLALALDDAKRKLKPLYEEYVANQEKLDDSNWFEDLMEPIIGSPVPDGRQDQLSNKARTIMYGISGEITMAGAAIKPPAPYQPPRPQRVTDLGPEGSGSGSGGGVDGLPVLIPPPVRPASPAPRQALDIPPAASSTRTGPDLTALSTTPPGPPTSRLLPPSIQPAPVPPTGPGIPPIAPPVGPGPLGRPPSPNLGRPTPLGPTMGTTPPRLANPAGRIIGQGPGPTGMRAMPPGGVIGGRPGAGVGRPGAARPISRVNPSGGVIGGQAVPTGRSGNRRADEESLTHWDPDTPWEVEEGVAPVVLPANAPRRQDPGPAIGRGR